MKKHLILISFLLFAGFTMGQKIKAYQYWVDDDVAGKVTTAITPVKDFHLQAELPMSSVTVGFHFLNMRFCDSTNRWSSVISQYFIKHPAGYNTVKQIVAYEYWIDDGLDGKTRHDIIPSSVFHLTENLELGGITTGFHLLNLRFRDNTGVWSSVASQYFVKYPQSPVANKQIVGYEYWIDEGIANTTYQEVSPSTVFHLSENLDFGAVSNGFHLLYLRFKDNAGTWSSVTSQYFVKYGQPAILPNNMVTYRFWLDNDPGTMETYTFPQPAGFVKWADTIEMPFLDIGPHLINYQFKDTNQIYSSVKTDTFNVVSCLPYSGRVVIGANSVCVGQAGVAYSIRRIRNASGYVWSVPLGATIVSGQGTRSIVVDYSYAADSGQVSVYGTNICGVGPTFTMDVAVHPPPIPTLAGEDTVCSGSSGWVYTTETGKSNYTWSVSPGNTITAGGTPTSPTATVTWNSSGGQWIRVSYTSEFGCAAANATQADVFAKQSPVPAISGPNSVCIGTSGAVYSAEPGMANYAWGISPGGTITSGGTNTSNTITVTWNASGAKWVNVSYTGANGCSASIPTQYNVTVNPLPVPIIGGNQTACINSSVSYSTYSGMTNYTWSVSAGGTITGGGTTGSYTIRIYWHTPGAQTVSVSYTNSNGCTALNPAVKNCMVSPLPVPVINGASTACQGSTGNQYATESGMGSYAWTVSAGGTIVGSATGHAISVTWDTPGSKTVTVNYSNSSGCRAVIPTQFNVAVNPLPAIAGSISGPAQVVQGQTGVAYSVGVISGATGYSWSLSSGATIVSGENTANIMVDFGTGAISGNVTVHGTNTCGNGGESPPLEVQVIPASLTLQNVDVPNGQVKCYSAVQTIDVAGNGTAFTIQSGGSATMVAGQKIIYHPTTTVVSGGYLHGYITTNGQYCGTQTAPLMAIVAGGAEPITMGAGSVFRVYPNPTTGNFTLEQTDKEPMVNVEVAIYNIHGEKLWARAVKAERTQQFSLSNRPPGLYFIHVLTERKAEILKVIRQ